MKKNSLYYSKAVKIRFRSWIYMKPPFGKTIDNVIYWRGWEKADDFLEENVGKMKYLIELPLAFVALVAVIIPLIICAIIRNNVRILWRYFKHVVRR